MDGEMKQNSRNARGRPLYWNLIAFAGIGAIFSLIAMYMVEAANRSEIAVLYLGLIGGYAASIKELDLARLEIEKLRSGTVENADGDPDQPEDGEKK